MSASFGGFKQSESKAEAYLKATELNPSMPCIILVNPFLDSNVGSVARNMLNFGLHELRIVSPVCDISSESAKAMSAGAVEVLLNAKVFPSLEECVADLTRVFATTIRPRGMTQLIYTPEVAAEILVNATTSTTRTGILFGRERSGLTNDEVALADAIISIPTFKHFSSLNLAQAVNVVSYEIFKQSNIALANKPPETWLHASSGERLARRDEVRNLLRRLETALIENNYQKDLIKREVSFRSMGNLLQRIMMTNNEVNLLHGVLTNLAYPKVPGSNNGAEKGDMSVSDGTHEEKPLNVQ